MTADLGKGITTRTHIDHKQNCALLRYIVSIHGIFVEILINREWNLNRNNISEESIIFEEIIKYFYEWNLKYQIVKRTENISVIDLSKYYIESQTYEHLLTLVRGFVGYSYCNMRMPTYLYQLCIVISMCSRFFQEFNT